MCAPLRDAIIRDKGLSIGGMAYGAAGLAGLLCVLFASWTTANPTLYRAGLALQIATPRWPRWKVTLTAGLVTSAAACFPFFVMQLLDFVAIFGLVLMPIGAIVFAEHWLFPRLGLVPCWAERRGLFINPAALIAWAGSLLFCFLILGRYLGVHLFFLWPPGYAVALLLYIALARLFGAKSEAPSAGEARSRSFGSAAPAAVRRRAALPAWRQIARAIAVASIAAIAAAGVGRAAGSLSEPAFYAIVNIATLAWFAGAPPWLAPDVFRPVRATTG